MTDKALEAAMDQIAHKEQIGIWANELTSALSLSDFLREDWSFDDSVDLEKEVAAQLLDIIRSAITHPGLNLVASLQAMQARAEKAERERDEWKLIADLSAWADGLDNPAHPYVNTIMSRAEAAEARVKELEDKLSEAADEIEGWGAYASEYFQEKHDLPGVVREFREFALTGGSNG